MDQVFDFREFLLWLVKKCKVILLFAVILLILGAAFGWYKGSREQYMTTASANVNLSRRTTDSTALTSTMQSIKEYVTDNYFYNGLLDQMRQELTQERFSNFFRGNKEPKLDDLKKVITVYTRGNLVLIDVISGDKQLSIDASKIGQDYIVKAVSQPYADVVVTVQGQQTVDLRIQNGDTVTADLLKFGILGFGGGIVLGILFIFFVQIFDLRVKEASDLRHYHIPVFGTISAEGETEK